MESWFGVDAMYPGWIFVLGLVLGTMFGFILATFFFLWDSVEQVEHVDFKPELSNPG